MAGYSHNANCITPAMTAYNAPSPVVITQSGYTSPNAGWCAFNQTPGTWYYNDPYNPQWLDVDLGISGAMSIISYTLSSPGNDVSYPGMPVTWVLKGSNVDNAWLTADILDTQTTVSGWGNNEMRTYPLSSPSSAYRYYRIEMSVKEGSDFGWQVAQLELIGSSSPPPSADPGLFNFNG